MRTSADYPLGYKKMGQVSIDHHIQFTKIHLQKFTAGADSNSRDASSSRDATNSRDASNGRTQARAGTKAIAGTPAAAGTQATADTPPTATATMSE
jgi:hypothetical protein